MFPKSMFSNGQKGSDSTGGAGFPRMLDIYRFTCDPVLLLNGNPTSHRCERGLD